MLPHRNGLRLYRSFTNTGAAKLFKRNSLALTAMATLMMMMMNFDCQKQMLSSPSSPSHYRVIILVLSSHLNSLVKNNRKVWHRYMHLYHDIKVFLVYGNSFQGERLESDLVFMDVEENYNPGMLNKTLLAMEYIDQHYTYDFFLRTNIGTFWDFKMLKEHLDTLPASNCYSGDGPFENAYLSGTDTLVNGYMVKEFLKHRDELNYGIAEDKAMGIIFHGHIGAPFLKSRIFFMENFVLPDEQPIVDKIHEGMRQKADHYRVKNHHGDRNVVDIACYICLCKEIYSLNISYSEFMIE